MVFGHEWGKFDADCFERAELGRATPRAMTFSVHLKHKLAMGLQIIKIIIDTKHECGFFTENPLHFLCLISAFLPPPTRNV